MFSQCLLIVARQWNQARLAWMYPPLLSNIGELLRSVAQGWMFFLAGGEKSRLSVRTGRVRRRWVWPRSVGRVGGAGALDVGI